MYLFYSHVITHITVSLSIIVENQQKYNMYASNLFPMSRMSNKVNFEAEIGSLNTGFSLSQPYYLLIFVGWLVGWLVGFYGISTVAGYLTSTSFLCK